MFVKNIDASRYMKIGEKLGYPLDSFVKEIGEEYVVPVVTNNDSNYVSAGKNLF